MTDLVHDAGSMGPPPRRWPTRWRTRRRRAALCLVLPMVSACYTTVPLAPVPAPGTTVVLDLNDQGRVEFGPRIGPGATTIEGTLNARTDSSVSIRVGSVRYLNGQTNAWSGEPLTIPTRLIGQSWQRNLSRGRVIALGATVAAAMALIIMNTNLLGGSSGGPGGEPGGGTGGT